MTPKPITADAEFIPWNKGKAQGQKTPFTQEQVRTIKALLAAEHSLRDLCLFSVGIDTSLRCCDLLALTVQDVKDMQGNIRPQFDVLQGKTGRRVRVELSPATQEVVRRWIADTNKFASDHLFTGLRRPHGVIYDSIARRLVKQWASMARHDADKYSMHSLRRTKPTLLYQMTGNAEAARIILGQSNIASTSHYLGVGVDDALSLARGVGL